MEFSESVQDLRNHNKLNEDPEHGSYTRPPRRGDHVRDSWQYTRRLQWSHLVNLLVISRWQENHTLHGEAVECGPACARRAGGYPALSCLVVVSVTVTLCQCRDMSRDWQTRFYAAVAKVIVLGSFLRRRSLSAGWKMPRNGLPWRSWVRHSTEECPFHETFMPIHPALCNVKKRKGSKLIGSVE
jgi:hypothetical protein